MRRLNYWLRAVCILQGEHQLQGFTALRLRYYRFHFTKCHLIRFSLKATHAPKENFSHLYETIPNMYYKRKQSPQL
jgi:hypothetical protein